LPRFTLLRLQPLCRVTAITSIAAAAEIGTPRFDLDANVHNPQCSERYTKMQQAATQKCFCRLWSAALGQTVTSQKPDTLLGRIESNLLGTPGADDSRILERFRISSSSRDRRTAPILGVLQFIGGAWSDTSGIGSGATRGESHIQAA